MIHAGVAQTVGRAPDRETQRPGGDVLCQELVNLEGRRSGVRIPLLALGKGKKGRTWDLE